MSRRPSTSASGNQGCIRIPPLSGTAACDRLRHSRCTATAVPSEDPAALWKWTKASSPRRNTTAGERPPNSGSSVVCAVKAGPAS
ncbi:hypothetical protein D918_02345 [Trichuris suis]|nr:hypothetical protein D918_02345 [Trichuris suis]